MNASSPERAVSETCQRGRHRVRNVVILADDHPHLTECACIDKPARSAERTHVTIILRNDQRRAFLFRQNHELHCFAQGERERLLDHHSQAALECQLARLDMASRRRGHNHRVAAIAVESFNQLREALLRWN